MLVNTTPTYPHRVHPSLAHNLSKSNHPHLPSIYPLQSEDEVDQVKGPIWIEARTEARTHTQLKIEAKDKYKMEEKDGKIVGVHCNGLWMCLMGVWIVVCIFRARFVRVAVNHRGPMIVMGEISMATIHHFGVRLQERTTS